jgi:outer membrane protein assembly factor BamD (BamD/ComL family)
MAAASLFLSIIVFAINDVPADESRQEYYAEQLFESGDYQAARRAYKRLLFYHADTQLRDVADYRIAQSYYHQNFPEQAERLFREFPAIHPNSVLRFQSQLMLGQLHFDAEKYSLARTTLFELLHASKDMEVVAAAHYLRGWCYVYTSDWNKAITEFRQVNMPETDVLQQKKSRQLADTLLNETPLSRKSPEVAGWLSTIVPGSGQFYVGKVKESLLAAAVSGVFIYLAADAVRERRYVDCAGISLVGWHFYWGNRIDARRFASEYNAQREQEFIETLKRQAEEVLPQR